MSIPWGEGKTGVTPEFFREWIRYDRRSGKLIAIKARDHVLVGQEVGWLDDRGYRRFILQNMVFFSHRVIWFMVVGYWPQEIDHKNGVRDDNTFRNLREVTPRQNSYSKGKRGTAPYKGITWIARKKTWQVQIGIDYGTRHLGYRKDPKEAALLYDAAAVRFFGEHAKTNKSLGLL